MYYIFAIYSPLIFILLSQGYLVNFDVQKTVWDYIFSKEVFNVNYSNTSLIITEPYFNFTSIQEAVSEIFFEEYEVDALLRINGNIINKYILRLFLFYICMYINKKMFHVTS